ncbi:MAG: hypothetical protein GYA55_00690 [SAR324 cluster bacterium]|uniref:Uncharacterized protein n=1 Tax=SAR324 cluster bacterium TaxID=2024889 RepID=A0A7X9FPT6_9DELT|nr:hypothetical protein [SAR324 cluster bacterium]
MNDYIDGIEKRFFEYTDIAGKLARLRTTACTAEHHLERFKLASKRLLRAKSLRDRISEKYEFDVLQILLYEAMDHVFMVFSALDLDDFDLKAPIVGQGFLGDYALDILSLFSLLEKNSERILKIEAQSELRLDFSIPLDEKEGVTFNHYCHWNNIGFEPYFNQASKIIHERLDAKPRVLQKQSMRDFLRRKQYSCLLSLLGRIENAFIDRFRSRNLSKAA